MDKGIKFGHNCPMCGKYFEKELNVTREQMQRYYNREDLIQNILPDLTPNEREFIKTGYCDKCQDILFASHWDDDDDDEEDDDEKKMECMNCDKEHAKECTETNCLYRKYLEEKGE
jgi:hypothetical protein